MAWVNHTPELVDQTDIPSSQPSFFADVNPVFCVVGTNIYAVLTSNELGAEELRVFKKAIASIGNGVGWSLMDSAGTPDPGNIDEHFSFYYNSSTGLIGIVYQLANGTQIRFVEFNTATDTYGSPSIALSVTSPSTFTSFIYQKADLTYVITWGTGTQIACVTYSGGWGAPTNLFASTGVIRAGISASDIGHICYVESSILKYFRLDAAFAAGSFVNISTQVASQSRYRATITVWGTTLIVGFVKTNGTVWVSVGTPLAGPTFTPTQINYTPSNTSNITYPTVEIGIDGNPTIFWDISDNGDFIEDQIDVSVYNGVSWSNPVVFYDQIANPPANSPAIQALQFIHTGQSYQKSNGDWITLNTMEREIGADSWSSEFAFLGVPGYTKTIEFSLIGGEETLLDILTTPTPIPPGPVTNPTECPNQDG